MLSFSPNIKNPSVEEFLTTKDASGIVPYSREYIGKLAREQMVNAIWRGGKWLVNADSLRDFYEQAKIEEEVLAERLRGERLTDQDVTEFLYNAKILETQRSSPAQIFLMHAVPSISMGVIIILFFFSVSVFENTSQVAQLFGFKQTLAVSNPATLEVVEVTTSMDVSNGVLLLPKATSSVAVDPTAFFSDEVEFIEGVDGQTYIRLYDGQNFSDTPVVRIPSQLEYYREAVDTTNPEPAT